MHQKKERSIFLKRSKGKYGLELVGVTACCFLGALLVEALTLFGSPFTSVLDFDSWIKKRIVVTWIALLVLYGACRLMAVKLSKCNAKPKRYFKEVFAALLLSGCVFCGLLAIKNVLCAEIAIAAILVIAAIVFSVSCVLFLRGYLMDKPEMVYLPVGIAFSLVLCFMAPIATIVSWDDHIHYDRSIAVSYLFSPEYTEADRAMINMESLPIGSDSGFRITSTEYFDYLSSLDERSEVEFEKCTGPVSSMGFNTLSYQALGYLPAAFGLWMARLLHLSFVASFCMGRLFNAIFFATLVYLGARRLKVGKSAVIIFSLLPTVVFLSASYSYDSWCIGWLLFGFLRYISWHQNPSFKMTGKEIGIVVAAFVLGCAPKAIYFPIFFVLLFVPQRFFVANKQLILYRAIVIGSALVVLATFLAPFLFSGPGSGDERGGSDVDSTSQIEWILGNPLNFAHVMASFLKGYISPAASGGYTDSIAYLCNPSLGGLPLVALLVFAVADNGEPAFSYSGVGYKIAAVLLLIGTAGLIAAALYVSFTPVGYYTVNGCQHRYLLPLIMPFVALGLNFKSIYRGSRSALNGTALVVAISFNTWVCFHALVPLYLN